MLGQAFLQTYASIGAALGLGALLGGVIFQMRLGRRLHHAEMMADQYADTLEQTKRALEVSQVEKAEALSKASTAEKEMEHLKGLRTAEQAAHDRQIKELAELRAKFDDAAKSALKDNSQHFLGMAQQFFEQARETQKTELDTKLTPVKETLGAYQKRLQEFEEKSHKALGAVSSEISKVAALHDQVREQTAKLTNALRMGPKTRGRWGEEQLQNVLELAGMAEHVDFFTEVSTEGEAVRIRPDAVIRMPGDRQLVVDVKANMSGYLDAIEATNDADREAFLHKHVQEIRQTIQKLSSKEYWKHFDGSTDMVVMFIPGDNFYSAAAERDPDLFSYALGQERRVLIATPTTMFAVAKSIAYGWQQAAISQDAVDAVKLVKTAYDRLITTGGELSRLGKGLTSMVNQYNKYVGSLEGASLPAMRKLRDLKGIGAESALPEVEIIEATPRPLAGRDLTLESDPKSEHDT